MANNRRWIRDPSAEPPKKRTAFLYWDPKDPVNADLERMYLHIRYGLTNETLVGGLREFAKVYLAAVAANGQAPAAQPASPPSPTQAQRAPRRGGIGNAALSQFGAGETVEK